VFCKDFVLWLLGILLCIAVPAGALLLRPAPQLPKVQARRPLTKEEAARRDACLKTLDGLQARYGHLDLAKWPEGAFRTFRNARRLVDQLNAIDLRPTPVPGPPLPPTVQPWRPLTKEETARRETCMKTIRRLQERYGHLNLVEWPGPASCEYQNAMRTLDKLDAIDSQPFPTPAPPGRGGS
jgi:hypothetical protein